MNRDEAEALLRRAVGDPNARFRDGQWEAIDALVNHHKKLLVVQRTGWGKSSVYFISARILRDRGAGPALVVSPLLALMRNQIEAAGRLGIRAVTINSSNREEWEAVTQQVLGDEVDVVLVAPERLANEGFVDEVLMPIANRVGLVVVDEAHCISDWGHDFRPDYRRLVNVLHQMPPNMPVLGTTATANDRVADDVCDQLGDIEIQRGPLERHSLSLQTLRLPDAAARLAWLAQHVPELPGTGIIYVLTKRDADLVALWLNDNGIAAQAYYSDVKHPDFEDSSAYRIHLEDILLRNELKALVATTALAMGYDKPDLHFVIHYQSPGSVVGYYQQVGRAGRAIPEAHGILLCGAEDEDIHEYFRRSAFPKEAHVLEILEALDDRDELSVRQLEEHVNLRQGQIAKVLKYLSVETPAPVIKQRSRWSRTPVAYQMDHERIQRLTQQREQEWLEVQRYIDTSDCLMRYLRSALGDPESVSCGRCANCLAQPPLSDAVDHDLGVQAADFLRHSEMPLKTNVQVARGAFEECGFEGNLPPELRAETGRSLSRWGDAGWGRVVGDDKHSGHFRDALVRAAAEMIRERWRPEPEPQWVAYVPSRRHPRLVPDFARRLANELRLPFVDAITKVRDNEPQKLHQNRFRQCRNLDGVFEVEGDVSSEAVLLVDDVVDSGWTLTVLAAQLRSAGSGPVFPIVLATARPGD